MCEFYDGVFKFVFLFNDWVGFIGLNCNEMNFLWWIIFYIFVLFFIMILFIKFMIIGI